MSWLGCTHFIELWNNHQVRGENSRIVSVFKPWSNHRMVLHHYHQYLPRVHQIDSTLFPFVVSLHRTKLKHQRRCSLCLPCSTSSSLHLLLVFLYLPRLTFMNTTTIASQLALETRSSVSNFRKLSHAPRTITCPGICESSPIYSGIWASPWLFSSSYQGT